MVGPLSAELGQYGIRVNSISPGSLPFKLCWARIETHRHLGYIQSPMTQELDQTNPSLVKWFRTAAPVGRLGVPQDLSSTVCLLLSDAGSFISGSDILISGKP
jgi:NAD(P)-dependent dehydrogenase (short-subunit alcohol dehydrogenase family)